MKSDITKGFEDLELWKECRTLRIKISLLVKSFPKEEKYMLISQILRSSRSISANIAEGYGRFHYKENIQFCRQARGSLSGTLDHLICSYDENYITENQLKEFKITYDRCLKLINGYILYLKKRKDENS